MCWENLIKDQGIFLGGHFINRPFALRRHVTLFLWKWKWYDFAFEKNE